MFAALDAFAADGAGRVHAFCHAVPGAWHAMGVMLSAAGSLQWLRDTVAAGESFDALTAQAAVWGAGTEGLTFLPYLVGERTPHADPDARASFTGLTVRHNRGALVRAVLEGVAYGLRDSLDLIVELGGKPALGRVSGGGARSDCGWRSSRRCWSCRWSGSRSTRARRSAPRSSAGSRRACGPTCTRA